VLTRFEVEGLVKLVKYVEGLYSMPPSKRGIPKDLLDPQALLADIKVSVHPDHGACVSSIFCSLRPRGIRQFICLTARASDTPHCASERRTSHEAADDATRLWDAKASLRLSSTKIIRTFCVICGFKLV
jgi:hypothetical protein